jgi:hypothetical protein
MALTAARLRDVLRYDREAGEFVWRRTLSPGVPAGSIAAPRTRRDSHRQITVDRRRYQFGRLLFLYENGEMADASAASGIAVTQAMMFPDCMITAAGIADYAGAEIPECKELGLDPGKR